MEEIQRRRDIAEQVYNILKNEYGGYQKETFKNRAMLELYDNPKLTANQIVELITPELRK
jgi:hypothetical protein